MDDFFLKNSASFGSPDRFVQPGDFPVDPAIRLTSSGKTSESGLLAASRVSKMAPVRGLFSQRVQKLDDFEFAAAQRGLAIAEEQHVKVVVEQFA